MTDPIRAGLAALDDDQWPLLPLVAALCAVLDLCDDMDQQDINAVQVAALLIRRVIAEHLGTTP